VPSPKNLVLGLCPLVVVATMVAACGEARTSSPATVTVTVERQTPRASKKTRVVARASLTQFSGNDFSIRYPANWVVETHEQDKGGYLDTTIRSPRDPWVYIRVDLTPDQGPLSPDAQARPIIDILRPQNGYRLLGYELTTFAGYEALRWEYRVTEHGVPLRKVNMFFQDDAGNGFAVLTEARANSFTPWLRTFSRIRASFAPAVSAGVVAAPAPPPPAPITAAPPPPPSAVPDAVGQAPATSSTDFCNTHDCIPNFPNGNGSIVQCNDGSYSHSGGIQGACSHHGGVSG
jgi:hypothetical protein